VPWSDMSHYFMSCICASCVFVFCYLLRHAFSVNPCSFHYRAAERWLYSVTIHPQTLTPSLATVLQSPPATEGTQERPARASKTTRTTSGRTIDKIMQVDGCMPGHLPAVLWKATATKWGPSLTCWIYTINLLTAKTLGWAYDGGRASTVGL